MRRGVIASTLCAVLGFAFAAPDGAHAGDAACVRAAGKVICGRAVGNNRLVPPARVERRRAAAPSARTEDTRGGNDTTPERRSAEDEAFLDALVRHRESLAGRAGPLPGDHPLEVRVTPRGERPAARATRFVAPGAVALPPVAGVLPQPRPGAVDARAAPGEAAFTGPRRARHVVFADPHGQAAAPAPAEPLPAATDSATADAGEARAAGAPPGVRDRTAAVIGAASRPRTPVWPGSRPYAADTRQPGFAPGRGATAPADDEHARARP